MSVAVFLLAFGATARITRFINADYLFRGVREWAIRVTRSEHHPHGNPDHDLPYLLTCPWCASPWIGGGVYTVAYFYGHTAAFWIVCATLSGSYVYAVLSQWVDPLED